MPAKYPGYSAAWGSCHDWKPTPAQPYAWVHYERDGTRTSGFADTIEEAERLARAR